MDLLRGRFASVGELLQSVKSDPSFAAISRTQKASLLAMITLHAKPLSLDGRSELQALLLRIPFHGTDGQEVVASLAPDENGSVPLLRRPLQDYSTVIDMLKSSEWHEICTSDPLKAGSAKATLINALIARGARCLKEPCLKFLTSALLVATRSIPTDEMSKQFSYKEFKMDFKRVADQHPSPFPYCERLPSTVDGFAVQFTQMSNLVYATEKAIGCPLNKAEVS